METRNIRHEGDSYKCVVPDQENQNSYKCVASDQSSDSFKYSAHGQSAGLQVTGSDDDKYLVHEPAAPQRRNSKRKIWIAIGFAIVVVVIIAIVVPVMVLRNDDDMHPGAEKNSAQIPDILANSSVAATATNVGQGLHIRLVFQDDDDSLHMVSRNSSSSGWTTVAANFTKAKKGSPLAIANFPRASAEDTVYALFYLGQDNQVREWTWNSELPESGTPGSMDMENIVAHPDSKLAAYWPHVLFSNDSQILQEMNRKDDAWEPRYTRMKLADTAGMSIIPADRFSNDKNVFVQVRGGNLRQYNRNTKTLAYKRNGTSLNHFIPPWSSVSSFAMLNEENPQRVDTFFLCQDAANNILLRYRDDDSGWKGPLIPKAFEDADRGTSITCTTTYASRGNAMKQGADMPKCYFLADGKIKEVELDYRARDFKLLGYVAID